MKVLMLIGLSVYSAFQFKVGMQIDWRYSEQVRGTYMETYQWETVPQQIRFVSLPSV